MGENENTALDQTQFDAEVRKAARLREMRSIIEKQDADALSKLYDSMEPIDFAILIEDLDDDEVAKLTPLMDDDELAGTMENAEDDERIRIAHTLDNRRLLTAFSYMQKDDIVDMLSDFPIGRRKEVINIMKTDDRQIITKLLQYPEESAGGLMTTAFIALKGDYTAEYALEKIKQIGPKTEDIETVYIVDRKGCLIGFVDLRQILSAPKTRILSDFMDDRVIYVKPETDQEDVAKLVSKYDLNSIPVVSPTKQILGVVTVDDVIDVIIDEYNEDILELAGVSKEENLDTTLGESIRLRLPWLMINLLTAFLASFTVKLFESTIEQVVALSSIMTIISGMGGNAGTQTLSILVREISQRDRKAKEYRKPFLKELVLGLIDGASTGLVTAVVVCAVYGNIWLGVIAFVAMIGNMLVSAFFGFLIPLILNKCHADPAVSSSIFVTTATDVLGFFIFLGLAKVCMPLIS
ncbi:MAG: magnesium transporter [Eubacteriales bacterium]